MDNLEPDDVLIVTKMGSAGTSSKQPEQLRGYLAWASGFTARPLMVWT
jgi:hypothetical protein